MDEDEGPIEEEPVTVVASGEARGFVYRPDLVPVDYPIAEVFGHAPNARTPAAVEARAHCWCPFRDKPCTKLLSAAATGICSVRYRAAGFDENIWAVCANRLSGSPFQHVLTAHFGADASSATLVTEVRIEEPRVSFDGIGLRELGEEDEVDFVGIEAQTIDTRGGSLKPLWRSYIEGRPDEWRSYYPARPAFGVNTTNVWKRLLPQVMNKGRLFKGWRSKLYVVVQDSLFQFISRRMPLQQLTRQERENADIIWVRWDYTGEIDEKGQLVTELAESLFTTLEQVETAFVTVNSMQRPDFVTAVRAKRKRDAARRPKT